jgi:hypothetical protein
VQRRARRAKPTGLIVFITIFLLVLIIAAYIGVMNALVEFSNVENIDEAADRDAAYAYLHIGFLGCAAVIGFLAGKWFNGLGVAFSTLFVVVLVIAMLGTQMASYELACEGHNDLVRHWQC